MDREFEFALIIIIIIIGTIFISTYIYLSTIKNMNPCSSSFIIYTFFYVMVFIITILMTLAVATVVDVHRNVYYLP